MAKPSDKEYKLFRKIRELEDQITKLKNENAQLQKRLDKEQPKEKKEVKKIEGGCPVCNSPVKVTELPFGKLRLCSAACGWRKMDKE